MSLNIVYENRNVLVVSKNIGDLTQDSKDSDVSLLSEVKEKYPKAELINRLDRGVGGLVLIGKNDKIIPLLNKMQQEHKIAKKYIAIVWGSAMESQRLEDYLQKNQRLNMSKVVQKNSLSKLAILEYKKLDEKVIDNQTHSKLEVELFTGRHHQIRVQMANQGLPLFGDRKYNNKVRCKPTDNLGLFAYYLSFEEPLTKENIVLEIKPYDIEPFNLF